MRSRLVTAFITAFVILSPGPALYAQDVLLPSSDGKDAPNLGLSPQGGTTVAPAPDSAKPAPAASTDSLPFTPTPSSPAAAALPTAGDIPSSVVQQPEPSQLPIQQQLPPPPANMNANDTKMYNDAINSLKTSYVLNVGVANKSSWGAEDLALINARLGINKAQIPLLCHMSVKGLMLTDKGPFAFDMGTAAAAQAHFNGTISNVTAHVQALCTEVNLPPNPGLVMQIGNKYAIGLGGVICGPPAQGHGVRELAVLYSGDGSGSCIYQ